MSRYNVPRVIFVNKLDRMGGNPWNCIKSAREKLDLNCAAVQVPIGEDDRLKGVVDIIEEKAFYYEGANGENIRKEPVPDNLKEIVKIKRLELIEYLANVDEELEEMYLMEEIPSNEVLHEKIRKYTIERKFVPVFMGSAYKNKGVQHCLDGILRYLPSPNEK